MRPLHLATFWLLAAVTARGAPEPGDAPWRALERAIRDLSATFGEAYPDGPRYLERLAALERSRGARVGAEFESLREEALLANPLLDFDRLLAVKRKAGSPALGLPANWQGNCSLPRRGFDDELVALHPLRPGGEPVTAFKPETAGFVGDVDLDFEADRLLFSSIGPRGRWQVYEIDIDIESGLGAKPRRVTKIDDDVDCYDACYLPGGDIIFSSTAPFVGVPCVAGSSHVANLFLLERATGSVRRLTFDQDHDWCPTVLPGGRVLYLRWEYSDIPHFVSRILFHMNPDGTDQREYYGSNSYWPNSLFYARPIPGDESRFVAIVSGHHGVPRMGELVLFDTARGRHEASGAVQRIPGYGREVEPILRDRLVDGSWPKFLHPWPLSEKYFLVSAKPGPDSNWGIYLVDIFDNRLLLHEEEGHALLEPVPLRKTPTPRVLPSAVDPERKDGIVYMADVYSGGGLEGIPRGTVKKLRLFTYHFAYHGMGGQVNRVGLDGPWDIKRILGTVPVETDGSARFRVPANTPISVQPLDAEGKALQLMRSWMTVMPGERQSCVGCHERQEATPSNRATIALSKTPSEIRPWYGPTRGFSFEREVQPVLDRHCVTCHDGRAPEQGGASPDLRSQPPVHLEVPAPAYDKTTFPPSYLALRRFVRAATIESDIHLLTPMEFHADTTRLIQLLRKGHHGVRLDAEARDRLITWIDLNTPAHGTWSEIVGSEKIGAQRERRRALLARYAGRDEDPEAIRIEPGRGPIAPVWPEAPARGPAVDISCSCWPLSSEEARRRQSAAGETRRTLDLGGGVQLELVLVPAGDFAMGDANGQPDERPRALVCMEEPFWMGRVEVTNEQYRRFDPDHDSRLEHGDFLHFSERERGYSLREPQQPVVRVSWQQALEFCRWLSERTGERVSLPTEAQWEYACRAGTDTPLAHGGPEDDFSAHANLADASLRKVDLFDWGLPVGAIPAWRPAELRFDDGARVSAPVGSYQPNAWGLHDMHGNAAEWTLSRDAPYPYADDDGRNRTDAEGRRIVRGGSWYDRPGWSRSASRLSYRPYQRVYDVGFRIVCEIEPATGAGSGRTESAFRRAAENGELAGEQYSRCRRFVDGWLARADRETGLIPRNLTRDRDVWNARDAAADNYPFMVLTAAITERSLFEGRMLDMLRMETKLTSRLDRLPDTWSFSKKDFRDAKPDLARIIFGSSEYVKDGLLPLTEWLGPSPWSARMLGIVDDIWKHAGVETPYGKIPSTNVEVNGEMLQALSRLYWMTGKAEYLEYATRLGDYYLLGGHHPTRDFDRLRLRDHGCEIVSGLCELYATVHSAAPDKKKQYRAPIHEMCDRVLDIGRDSRGMLYNWIEPRSGKHDKGICDTWGYNYNGIYTVYLIDGTEEYRQAVRHALSGLREHLADYHWGSADEYADSIEGAINLLNREDVTSAAEWIDGEIDDMWKPQRPDGVIEGWHGDGNSARTAIMYALWKSQGLTVQPWREDVRCGAVREGDTLHISLSADRPWSGEILFDRPRHADYLHLPLDYPRINQFPEWFTTRAERRYTVRDLLEGSEQVHDGKSLQSGLPVTLKPGVERRLIVGGG